MTQGRMVHDPNAINRAERDQPAPTPSTGDSSTIGALLDLQRSAGNQAVGQALVGAQRAPAAPAASTRAAVTPARPAVTPARPATVTLQLGAIWQDLVVRSLARARERLDRRPAEFDAALQDIDTALAGIASVKNVTPTEDDNHVRLDVLERRVRSFRDLVAGVAGKGKDDRAIERDMIGWRAEAVALGNEFNEPTGDIYPNTHPADWKEAVVDGLWSGQQAFSQGDIEKATSDYDWADVHILQFTKSVPGYQHFKLLRLQAGVEATSRLMRSRTNNIGPLTEAAIGAYETAAFLGSHLAGNPVDDDVEESRAGDRGAKDPDFTWERPTPTAPVKDDTALERP